ncbi:DNA primase [Buchnera aphidicola]|uniref:DNA primase n=1 Tax=Buchnera aphidicola TaxID=9 RepID=UPI002237E6A4|nr:DNA primase [Buchnera aphidicola]MCW5197382.1 DNA primase [Buchnera aphidicola (Chaitophorus viminalis)]
MIRKIPKSFINELLLKTNIVDLIQSKINLQKKGKNYQTKCPFHEEKTPSFVVSYEKQFYHCFGCHVHGNAIDFLINYDGLNFIECIEELSILNNINIPFKKNNSTIEKIYYHRKNLYELMNNISYIYHKNIFNKNSIKALKYIKSRKIKNKIIKLFLIGYSNKNTLNKILNTQLKIYTKENIIQTGIANINYLGQIYDKFNQRIILPIRDKYGRIHGFGGRSLKKDKFPKYINSQETEIFHKKKIIYGLYEIKSIKKNIEYLIVVEGYFDVILLTQFKITNVISILGTACTKEHFKILFNITKTIIFCYDGDTAGKKASWNTLINSLPYLYEDRNIKFIFLSKNEDPDSFIKKKGTQAFQKKIKKSIYMSEYLFQYLIKKYNLNTIEGKKDFIYNAISLIKKIRSHTYKLFLYKLLGKKVGILDENYFNIFLKKKYKNNYSKKKKYSLMKILISLIIQNPKLHILIKKEKISKIKYKGIKIFTNILKKCYKNPQINTGFLLEQYREKKIYLILKYLSIWNHMISKKKIKKTFLELINSLYIKSLKNKLNKLLLKEQNQGLNYKEKNKFWLINKKIIKKYSKNSIKNFLLL